METQEEIDRLAAAIYRERVLRARLEAPVEKLMDGIRLFEHSLQITKAGVAAELATDDEAAIMAGVQERFEKVRRMRESKIYRVLEQR